MTRPRIAITTGEPAGIGPEIVLQAVQNAELASRASFLVLGSVRQLQLAADALTDPVSLVQVDLGFHEYDWPPMWRLHEENIRTKNEGGMWLTLRYRRTMRKVREAYGDRTQYSSPNAA